MRVGGSEGRREEGRREGGGNREWVSFVPEQKILKRPFLYYKFLCKVK